ncbi:MAG: hypothetical protein KF842_06780 [Caulobacter sp.]|nr:hypothetical protein [Caulobacter sp.]
MTAPIETAYAALAAALADGLVAAGFLADAGDMQIDPPFAVEPDGDETESRRAAELFRLETRPVRDVIGGGVRRYVVERGCRLELASFGPLADGEASHEDQLGAVFNALAPLPGTDPTLGQTCERLMLTEALDDDLPPNGLKKMITFVIRLRSGDPLGRTAP